MQSDKKILKETYLWNFIKKDYHIDKLLGEGTYGKVMKCTSKSDGKPYAIKLMVNMFCDV